MSDKWMNLGYDNQDLKPYCEPTPDFKDERRIGEHLSLSLIKFAWLLLVLSAMVSWHIFVFSHHHQNDHKDMSFLRGILITSCGGVCLRVCPHGWCKYRYKHKSCSLTSSSDASTVGYTYTLNLSILLASWLDSVFHPEFALPCVA